LRIEPTIHGDINRKEAVIPAKAGIQDKSLDSGLSPE
jgi:hypothetical protein